MKLLSNKHRKVLIFGKLLKGWYTKMAKKKSSKKVVEVAPIVPKINEFKKTDSNLINILKVSVGILVIAIILCLTCKCTKFKMDDLISKIKFPVVTSALKQTSIKIEDPKTNKTYTMEVKPASASQTAVQAVTEEPAASALGAELNAVQNSPASALAEQAAAEAASKAAQAAAPQAPVVPVAVATSTNIAARCKIYLTEIDAKANIHRMDIEDAKYIYDNDHAIFIDARGPNEFAEAHIKGAINIPVTTSLVELEKLKSQLQGKLLVTYCHGVGCHLSDKTAYLLFDAGYRKVGIFFGGWPKWNEHKYPIDTQAPKK